MAATQRRANRPTRAIPPLTVVVRKLVELKPNPRNARRHSEAQIAQLAGVMRRFGWTNPMLIDEDDYIIAGHARLLAGQSIALSEGPTITIAGLSEREKRELMLADNRIQLNASWDADLLRAELMQLRGEGADLEGLGFADAEIDKLVPPAEADPAIEEIDISTVQDRFWISVRGPLAQQAEALQRLKTLMGEVPGVSVELGTIDG
jgi:ParB-like chromosome segregation protein Spo0J